MSKNKKSLMYKYNIMIFKSKIKYFSLRLTKTSKVLKGFNFSFDGLNTIQHRKF